MRVSPLVSVAAVALGALSVSPATAGPSETPGKTWLDCKWSSKYSNTLEYPDGKSRAYDALSRQEARIYVYDRVENAFFTYLKDQRVLARMPNAIILPDEIAFRSVEPDNTYILTIDRRSLTVFEGGKGTLKQDGYTSTVHVFGTGKCTKIDPLPLQGAQF
jgi:hypothetical protein